LNPQAAGLDAREAEARAAQDIAAGLTPEPGSVSIGNLNDRFNRNQGKQEYEVELAVPLWLPGQKTAREAEAASRLDETVARRAALRLEVGGELREAWWALAAARSAKLMASRRLETARALESDVMRRYRVGELSRIDANLAQSETHAANAELIEAEANLLQAEQAVQVLTGSPAPKNLDEESPTTRRLADETGDSAASHPLLAVTAAAARSARARVKVADESRRAAPELTLRVVRERDGLIEAIEEKPVQTFVVNAGIYVLSPHVLDLVPRGQFFDMPWLFEAMARKGLRTRCHHIDGYWLDIGRLPDYERANLDFDEVFR